MGVQEEVSWMFSVLKSFKELVLPCGTVPFLTV